MSVVVEQENTEERLQTVVQEGHGLPPVEVPQERRESLPITQEPISEVPDEPTKEDKKPDKSVPDTKEDK